jgi:hypothetical protein
MNRYLIEARYRLRRLREHVTIKAAWLLPRSIAYWAAIRVMAHASQGQWSNQNVPDLTAVDALKRWEKAA